MITDAEKAVLIAEDDWSLAEWYSILNTWGWPDKLPNPCRCNRCCMTGACRRRAIMDWIYEMVGERLISRVWNKKMTDQEFEDFWKATWEKDPEAKVRYQKHLERRAEEFRRLHSSEFDAPLT